MSATPLHIFCALALAFQSAVSQCTSRAAVVADRVPAALANPYGLGAPALAYEGLATPFAYDGVYGWPERSMAYEGLYPNMAPAMDFTPTSGGGLPVTSASAIPPTGISVVSENLYEGPLVVAGELPFVGTTAMEGVVISTGAAAINHACGNGINAMVSENTAFTPEYVAAGIVPEYAAAAIAPAAVAISPASFAAPGLAYRSGWGGCAL